jgi:LDH2 family malate/lactate/ureidoglycolate dehydrogenase
MSKGYKVADLTSWATAILQKVGLELEPAAVIAKQLVDADLFGYSTHGLALLSAYAAELEAGKMTSRGQPDVISDFGAAAMWDAKRLPGVWTTHLAVVEACKKADRFGVGSIALRNSHHIACLTTFVEEPARAGKLVFVLTSDPGSSHVAPYGGTSRVFTPNPIAAGIPTTSDPILIDVSTSITTAAKCDQAIATATPFPGPWLLDSEGKATNDARVMKSGGSILPIGGTDHGHKGYGLSIVVEALTQGLAGFGRADKPTGWGACVQVLAFNPAAFGGAADFTRQTDWLVDACHGSRVPAGGAPVRLPGEAALKNKARGIAEGVPLGQTLASALEGLGQRLGIALPSRD